MFTDSKSAVLESAARWYARLNAPDCTDVERARFQSWKQQDPSHAEAYAAAEQSSRAVSYLGATDPRLKVMADRAFAMGAADTPFRSNRNWRRVSVSMALAASTLVAVLGISFMNGNLSATPETTYTTAAAEHRDITLQDGSVVHLDVASSIKVRLKAHQRQIELTSGRAFFEVAHDAARPFTVSVHGEHVTALGTRFQVERDDQYLLVTLAEGSIAVTDDASGAAAHRDVLIPGEQLKIAWADNVRDKQTVDAESATSWSHGRLVFRATPLASALDEVNRYATRKVRIADPTLAQLPVSGSFIMGDSALTVSALVAVLPVRAVDAGQEIMLFPRQGG